MTLHANEQLTASFDTQRLAPYCSISLFVDTKREQSSQSNGILERIFFCRGFHDRAINQRVSSAIRTR
jgi:hypothetical protein